MLNKKVHICECGRRSYGFKKCGVCRSKVYAEKSRERKREVAAQGEDIGLFFERHIKQIEKLGSVCAECGCGIKTPSSKNVAHILKKSIFKSVATEDLNILYLCWQHHSDFDSTFEKAKKMRIWAAAVGRVSQFRFLIKERHKYLQHFFCD
mgnify:CR=1 FL=1